MMISNYAANGEVQQIPFNNGMKITVADGDNLVFDVPATVVEKITKKGVNLQIEFGNQQILHVERFFVDEQDNRESLLTFQDGLFSASEIAATAEDGTAITLRDLAKQTAMAGEHVLMMDGHMSGGSSFKAVADTLFTYQFRLSKEFPSDAKVIVKVNGHAMPKWLKLKTLGNNTYLLSGMPQDKDVGDMDLEIEVEI